ncbi:hypothetical protein ACWEKT_28225 [Nocardia takedensis]
MASVLLVHHVDRQPRYSDAPPESVAANGKYSAAGLANACDVLDMARLTDLGHGVVSPPSHTEVTTSVSTTLICNARFQKGWLSLTAQLQSRDSLVEYYRTAERLQLSTTGSGRRTGKGSGLGEDSFHAVQDNAGQCMSGVLDSNLFLQVTIGLSGRPGEEVRILAEEQLRGAMDRLRA